MLVYTDIVTKTVINKATASLLAVLPLPAKQALPEFTSAKLAYNCE